MIVTGCWGPGVTVEVYADVAYCEVCVCLTEPDVRDSVSGWLAFG